AGAGAYILVRRRLERGTEEPLVELPLTSVNGYGTGNGLNGSYRMPAASSAERAVIQAEAVTPSVPVLTKEPMASQPRSQMAGSMGQPEPAGERSEVAARRADPREEEGAQVDASQLERAPFIGDIHTMIYHDADDDNLPAEENRIYFMSEEEARAAGYRRDYEV
ncbi:MAG TPA: hypothetical protein VF510_10175, partial [Ktedonobacterales bacterium]